MSRSTLHTLRVFLSLCFLMYGTSKLLGWQFSDGDRYWDTPIRHLSGMQLLWAFFAWSRPLQIVVGLGQIGSAFLLMGRRTGLWGAIAYLPLISAVVLFDLCYYVVQGATTIALVLLAVNLLVLWGYRDRLTIVARFLTGQPLPEMLPAPEPLPTAKETRKATGAALALIALLFFLIEHLTPMPDVKDFPDAVSLPPASAQRFYVN